VLGTAVQGVRFGEKLVGLPIASLWELYLDSLVTPGPLGCVTTVTTLDHGINVEEEPAPVRLAERGW
jgi:hypothetical protein